MNVDVVLRAVLRKLHKNIEIRWQIARGRKPSTARRSAGQLFKKRRQHGLEQSTTGSAEH